MSPAPERTVVIILLKAMHRVTGELLHQEQVALAFPRGGQLYLGGQNFTKFHEHETIGYHLRSSTLNNRIHPNSFNQKVRPSDGLYCLRVKLLQVPYELKTEHVETLEFPDKQSCKAYLDTRPKDTIGPLWEGRYN